MIDEQTYRLAAKYVGKEIHHFTPNGIPVIVTQLPNGHTSTSIWNPAGDTTQAFKLAIDCGFTIKSYKALNDVSVGSVHFTLHPTNNYKDVCEGLVMLAASEQELLDNEN